VQPVAAQEVVDPIDDENKDLEQALEQNMQLKTFMRTPCNHIFHKTCFAKWLEQGRGVCPNCV